MSETVLNDFCEEFEIKYYEFMTILDVLIEYNMIGYRNPNIISACIKDEELSQLFYEIEKIAKFYKNEISEDLDSSTLIELRLNMYNEIIPIKSKIRIKSGSSIFDIIVNRTFDNILNNKSYSLYDIPYCTLQLDLLYANRNAYFKKENAKVLSKTNK